MRLWRSTYGEPAPVEVEAEALRYGLKDSTGHDVYANTHFETLAEAWKRHVQEHEAGEQMACRNLREAERDLARCKDELIAECLKAIAAREAHRKYLRAAGGGES